MLFRFKDDLQRAWSEYMIGHPFLESQLQAARYFLFNLEDCRPTALTALKVLSMTARMEFLCLPAHSYRWRRRWQNFMLLGEVP